MSRFAFFIAWIAIPWLNDVSGQDLISEIGIQTTKPSPEELAQYRIDLKEALERLRSQLKAITISSYSYGMGKFDDSEEWNRKYDAALNEGRAAKQQVMDLAYPIIRFSPELDEEMQELAVVLVPGLFKDHQYEMTYQIARRVVKWNPNEETELYLMRSALLTNRFEVALEYRDKLAAAISKLPKAEIAMIQGLPLLLKMVEVERPLYAAGKQRDDLPQVEIETDCGTMVVELYEDQYPDTVGHFVSLVEKGFYDNVAFHRVTKNVVHFGVAQTGLLELIPNHETKQIMAQIRPFEYMIYDESPAGGVSRHHLRGVLSLVARQDDEGKRIPNSGGPEFLITLVPLPSLDGKQIPFGRIISGLEVMDKIRPNVTISEKDGKESPFEHPGFTIIQKLSVLRKRDHEYKPNSVPVSELESRK